MTKEEKIKEAWDFVWDKLNDTSKQCALKNNGFISGILSNDLNHSFTTFNTDITAWRPKSLQGIENNNGWIKIESEADLPKDNGITDYHVFMFTNQYKYIRRTYKKNQVKELWEQEEITHYQRIEKPKPPIY